MRHIILCSLSGSTLVSERKMCAFFSVRIICSISCYKLNLARYYEKCAYVLSTSYCCHTVAKIEFSRKIFEKYSNVTKIRPVGTEFNLNGLTDGQTDEAKL